MDAKTPTITVYTEWQAAYDFFNQRLFFGELPDCIISLDNKGKKVLGYFLPSRYVSVSGEVTDGLAMNPRQFLRRSLFDTLSTLVHEMCHVWEAHYADRKSLRTYHNKEWGAKMESIGLMPSNTGLPGGKKTGQQMTHYAIEGGAFEQACKKLFAEQFKISWADRFVAVDKLKPQEPGGDNGPDKKIKSKNKYVCGECGAIVWGKPNLLIICGQCNTIFEMQK
jgi:predicted SprT family Zn-dependent metalloprotease